MSYATATTILTLLPGMPQTSTSGGYTATVALITSHISRAENVIDGKIVKRYDVGTFKTTGAAPPLLITLSEDITSYYTFRSLFSQDNQNFSEYTDKFNEAMATLDEIREAKIDLVNSTGSIVSERSTEINDNIDSTTKGYQTFFDIDSVTSWDFDDDRKDYVSDRR